ncbi:MAG TPA: hypothetical protein VGQ12_00575 [Candidatus Angelobacter sp.]|jgi:hypothetical protein|nr:hypothetical protein [Candidatus Angelobacter sp.]
MEENYLILKAFAENDKSVGIMYDNANPMEAPWGFGNTLAAALRNLADELERYGCDATPEDMQGPKKAMQKCLREHRKRLTSLEIE